MTTVQGDGLREVLHTATKPLHSLPFIGKRIKHTIAGPRTVAPERFMTFMNTVGNQPVVKLEVARKPVESTYKSALNLLSFGKFSKAAKKRGYDDVYHSYLVATLADGKQVIVEKNHVLTARRATNSDLKYDRVALPLPTNELNLKEMVNRTINTDNGVPASEESKRRVVQYDPSLANCQFFVKELLDDNGIAVTDPEAVKMTELQDSSALIDSLGPLAAAARPITDLAATIDRTIFGDGLAPGSSRRQIRFKGVC